jgi:excisionase family DNA binding protein
MLFPRIQSLGIIQGVEGVDPAEELRRLYPPILTTAHVAEMMHCTIGDVRDKVHRKELKAMRWGQQFRFFRDEVIATLQRAEEESEGDTRQAENG